MGSELMLARNSCWPTEGKLNLHVLGKPIKADDLNLMPTPETCLFLVQALAGHSV
jgi:hypothetical protein